jgi:hypothetical protein
MCPACLSTAVLLAAGGASAGGLAALVTKKIRARRYADDFSDQPNPRRTQHEPEQTGISENRQPR